ncbi:hypothetical protein CLOBY_03980 [Clostridium saccharobutylicum]|nr:hypothetical protein CLOSC_03710 [Clostridium saccharobutylicum]AQR98605.1 hypothetical protein CSACC_03710 [Clostridium saccharobutylicum]AQS08326.1 hypothetical protein CLOBY_03980 [Clostridium saccharobutylicum]AQS12595.1 hypothetical protein CLOSACC_03710 [Clostridium saccharobutylicum]MBA8982458.1 hypothetical protein [Clostridium saccharobutylicum]
MQIIKLLRHMKINNRPNMRRIFSVRQESEISS